MKKTAVAALAALTAAAFAAPMTMEEANAPMPAKVNGYLPDAAPESQGVPSAAIADWLGALDREGRHVHAFTILKNGYRIAEGAWAPYASVDRHSLYGLSGLFFADLIGRNLVCAKIESLPDAKVVEALRVKVAAHPNRETEAFWRLASNGDRVLDRNLLWMNRNFTTFLGFSWEGGCSAGDGLGRRTAVRHLALMGELHLRGGIWYGEKLLNANFAAQYYRFTTRPSGLKVAYGERGQLLMVSPKEHLVVAMTADTDQSERMVAITEENLLEDGERKTETRKCGEGTCDLKKVIASLRLETCDETAVPDGAVPFNATFDLAGNRYGFKTLRLEKTGAKTYVLELGGKETQILRFASAPNLLDVTFANGSKALTALNGKYRVSMTGGFTAPKKFRAVLYAVDTAAKFEWAIDFADTSRPVFTIVRHGEVKPEIVAGKPAETICGVKRDQTRAEILWTHPIHKRRYIGWPTVCRRKNGEVLASFSGNREGHVCPYGRSELVRSSDNGETWSTHSTIINNDIVDDRDTAILELASERRSGGPVVRVHLLCRQLRPALLQAAEGSRRRRARRMDQAVGGRRKDLERSRADGWARAARADSAPRRAAASVRRCRNAARRLERKELSRTQGRFRGRGIDGQREELASHRLRPVREEGGLSGAASHRMSGRPPSRDDPHADPGGHVDDRIEGRRPHVEQGPRDAVPHRRPSATSEPHLIRKDSADALQTGTAPERRLRLRRRRTHLGPKERDPAFKGLLRRHGLHDDDGTCGRYVPLGLLRTGESRRASMPDGHEMAVEGRRR